MISPEPRSASIISKGRSKVKRFPGDKLAEVIEKYPDVAECAVIGADDALKGELPVGLVVLKDGIVSSERSVSSTEP